MRIALRHSPHPSHEAPIPIQPLYANVFLDANWEAVERSEGLFVCCEVGIEGGGAVERALREELGDAVCLWNMSFIGVGDVQYSGREGGGKMERTYLTANWASAARRRNAFVTATELSSPFASCDMRFSGKVSVIFSSSAVRYLLARGIVFKGRSATVGRGGSTRESVESRCFCLSAATSCHFAPEEMVTVAAMLGDSKYMSRS